MSRALVKETKMGREKNILFSLHKEPLCYLSPVLMVQALTHL